MSKIENLSDMLQDARKKGYAVGSFSARYTKLIMPIIKAAMADRKSVV